MFIYFELKTIIITNYHVQIAFSIILILLLSKQIIVTYNNLYCTHTVVTKTQGNCAKNRIIKTIEDYTHNIKNTT